MGGRENSTVSRIAKTPQESKKMLYMIPLLLGIALLLSISQKITKWKKHAMQGGKLVHCSYSAACNIWIKSHWVALLWRNNKFHDQMIGHIIKTQTAILCINVKEFFQKI